MLILMVGTGLYFTVVLRGIQIKFLIHAFRVALAPSSKSDQVGDISPFQALMTTLAGSIGTGNIVGIATAVAVGGFGALFWMWVTGLLGMATTYAETLLAVEYRTSDSSKVEGGAMYTISRGLGSRSLAMVFAAAAALASFGIGAMVQPHSLADAVAVSWPVHPLWIGGALAILAGIVILGGIKNIEKVATLLVPAMALLYLMASIIVICFHIELLPAALALIFKSAFTGQAAAGGFAGSTMMMAVQMGVSRGVFSNEAGLGSSTFAAAAARTSHPSEQGLVSMTGTFVSTVVICTMTGLVLAVSGVLGQVDQFGGLLDAASLAIAAFDTVIPAGSYLLVFCLLFFGYTTTLAWAYYGEKSVAFLMGNRAVVPFRLLYILLIAVGPLLPLQLVWSFADVANGLMAIPNLLSLLFLRAVVIARSKDYTDRVSKFELSLGRNLKS